MDIHNRLRSGEKYTKNFFIRWRARSNTPASTGGSKDSVSLWITRLISGGVRTPSETALFMKRMFSYMSMEKNILDYGRHLGGDYLIRLHEEKEEQVKQRNEKRKQHEILSLIEQARDEWKFSLTMLEETTDSDLIDYVTYLVKSNEAKYRYLLKVARQEKISCAIWQD